MRVGRWMLLAAVLAIGFGGAARAALVLGSHVSTAVFEDVLGAEEGWAYLGEGAPSLLFTAPGTATLVARDSSYRDVFGTIGSATGTVVFGPGATPGSVAEIAPEEHSFRFFFQAIQAGKDSNIRFTDGEGEGPGAAQAGIDIFFNAAQSTWAFFYDDAGGGSGWKGDDNDYNDLIVTYRTASAVSEPAALALLAVGLAVLAFVVLRRRAALS